jgi:hypothetical protein
MSSGIAVGEHGHHHRAPIARAILCHAIQKRVGDLASRKIQVSLEPLSDREEHILQASFLAENRQSVGLAPLKAGDTGIGFDISDIGNGDIEPDGHPSLGRHPCLTMYDWIGVAVVYYPLEVDIPKPPGGFPGAVGKPCPVCVVVVIDLPVRLPDVPGSDNGVVQATPMDAPLGADRAVELFGEPCAIAVSGRGIEPVGIDLGRQDGQLV